MIAHLYSKINFEKTNYYMILLFAFMMPLSRATNSLFDALLIIFLLLQGNYKKHLSQFKDSSLAKVLLLFILYTIISLLWTDQLHEGLNVKKLYIQWFAIFAIALSIKKEQVFTVVSAFLFGMLVSEVLSYGMFFEFWTIKGKGADYPSPFMFHIDYSVFLGFSAVVLLNRMLSKRYSFKEKVLLTLFFLTVTGNLFINDGRTGQLAFFVGIVATVFIHFKINFKSIGIAALLISVLAIGAYQFSSKFQERVAAAQSDIQKITEGNLNSSWGYRVAMYSVAADIVKENPLIGVGVGDYQQASYDALQKNDHGFSVGFKEFLPKRHFHNQYLNVLVQGGLISLTLMLMIFYYLFKLPIHDPELKELSLLFGVVMLTAFVAEPLWLKQFTNMLFILFIGLFLGASLHGKSTTDNT